MDFFLSVKREAKPQFRERKTCIYSAEQLTIWHRGVSGWALVSEACSVVSDGFLCSGDDTAIMSELQHYHVAVRQYKSTAFGGKLGCQVGLSLAFAPECISTGMYMLKACICVYVNSCLTALFPADDPRILSGWGSYLKAHSHWEEEKLKILFDVPNIFFDLSNIHFCQVWIDTWREHQLFTF